MGRAFDPFPIAGRAIAGRRKKGGGIKRGLGFEDCLDFAILDRGRLLAYPRVTIFHDTVCEDEPLRTLFQIPMANFGYETEEGLAVIGFVAG